MLGKVGLSATELRVLEPHYEVWINGFCLLLPVGLGNGVGWRSLSLGGAPREGAYWAKDARRRRNRQSDTKHYLARL